MDGERSWVHDRSLGCVENCMITASGKYLDYTSPAIDQIEFYDIAVSLSKIARFNGHAPFYSVAQHCVLCAQVAMKEYDAEIAYHALLHDAAEAYVGDMQRPLKSLIPAYREIEHKIEAKIRQKFGTTDAHDDIVKLIDLRLLKLEKETFFPNTIEWNGFDALEDVHIEIDPVDHETAYAAFTSAYETLLREGRSRI